MTKDPYQKQGRASEMFLVWGMLKFHYFKRYTISEIEKMDWLNINFGKEVNEFIGTPDQFKEKYKLKLKLTQYPKEV